METTPTKKNTVEQTAKVEVVLNNFDIERLAEILAKMMPPIVDRMIRDEYNKKL
jgi:hypothetical protein